MFHQVAVESTMPGVRDMFETGSACNSIMSARILHEKRARRIAEDDALKLYNRVRQLQKEEERAQKRIVDTKRKAKDIVKYRERNERKLEEKEQRQKQLAEEVDLLKVVNLKAKEESLKARAETETKIYADKVAAVKQTKDERAELERLVAENRLLQRQKAFEAKEVVRKAQHEAETKMQLFKTAKLQMAQDEYEKRLKEEMEERVRKEREIEKLARLELELIERLKLKQEEQRQAYMRLEAALALGSTPLSSRRSRTRGASTKAQAGSSSMQQESSSSASGEPTDEDVARAFAVYDQDGVGEIATSALDGLLHNLGLVLNTSQLRQAVEQLDTQSVGRVTFGEFLLWWKG